MIQMSQKLRFVLIVIVLGFTNLMLGNTNLISSIDPNVISLTLSCGEDSLELCANLGNLIGDLESTIICESPTNGSLTNSSDTCFFYHPNIDFNGDDFACLIVCDDAMNCDTFQFEIFVEDCNQQFPCADISYDLYTESVENCTDLVKICNSFPLGEALLYDYSINGDPYLENIGICSFDTLFSYSLSSLPGGGMEGPYELESWVVAGNILGGTFDDLFELLDLLNMLDPSGNWILDSNTQNISTFNTNTNYGQMTIVQLSSADISILSKNSTTAPVGSSIYLPTGLHQVSLQHQIYSNCVDTFSAAIHCKVVKTNFDTLQINQIKTACIDTFNLPGVIQYVNADCENCDNLEYDLFENCVNYRGISEGKDTIMVKACDEFGFCDTLWQIVTIMGENNLPIARIDTDTTDENTSLDIDILGNDFINGSLNNIYIIIYPQNGDVIIGTDFSVTYSPEKDFCGIDGFAYEICNDFGCDTSTVQILVRCKSPLVYNGFSPNEDGINDTFKIFEIERYPLNELQVFNRWGNLVYSKANYQNEWKGNSFDGDILPDGTYFYLFEIEGEKPFSGYVQINR